MVRIIIYYYTKITLKGIVKRDLALLRKAHTQTERNCAYTKHQTPTLCYQDFAKSRTKIKNKILGNIFFGKLYIWVYGSVCPKYL